MDGDNYSWPWQRVEELVTGVVAMDKCRFGGFCCPFCLLLLLCYQMVSQGVGCDAVDGVMSSALSLAKNDLGYQGHDLR